MFYLKLHSGANCQNFYSVIHVSYIFHFLKCFELISNIVDIKQFGWYRFLKCSVCEILIRLKGIDLCTCFDRQCYQQVIITT